MNVIGTVIQTPKGNFRVRASYGKWGMHVPDAFKSHSNSIIRHKFLDYLYTDEKVRKGHYAVLQEIYPVISKLMGANSVKDGKIVPLGELQKENGVFYVEGTYRGETTRFYLFSEEQAKRTDVDLRKPAFAVIEDGYQIVDSGKGSYAIHVPENMLPNLRLFYGTFKSGEWRHVEQEFFAPLGEAAKSFDANSTRRLHYYMPGPAVRGYYDGNYDIMFDVHFGCVFKGRPENFGVLTDDLQGIY